MNRWRSARRERRTQPGNATSGGITFNTNVEKHSLSGKFNTGSTAVAAATPLAVD